MCRLLFPFFFLRFLSVIYSVFPWWHWRKWTAVAVMLIIQSFIWFRLTPTLILEISCSNWTIERMRELYLNRKWHHCTTVSAKAMVWRLGSQYHKNASSALFVIWYLCCSQAIWRKMAKERLRALAVVKYWNLGVIHWACHCCFRNN